MVVLISGFLLGYLLIYLVLGPLSWWLAFRRQDYPGVKALISNGKALTSFSVACFHGASCDARAYNDFLLRHPDQNIVSFSLGGHQLGPHKASPDMVCVDDVLRYIKQSPSLKTIVCHSTACSWIAAAYGASPETFSHIERIVWLSPNIGFLHEKQTQFFHRFLLSFPWVLPNPFWNFFNQLPFYSTSEEEQFRAKEAYKAGRLITFSSLFYYGRLLRFVDASNTVESVRLFVKDLSAKLNVYLAEDDCVVDNLRVLRTMAYYGVPSKVIPQTSHHGILLKDEVWFTS